MSIATKNLRGAFRKDIQVLTNDPANKDITFSIQATIQETLAITPVYVNFGRVPVGEQKVIEISLSNNGTEPITIKSLRANPAESLRISPQQKLILNPGEKKQLSLTLLAGKTAGIIEGSIFLKTNAAHLPEKNIYIRAEIIAPH